MFNSGGNYIYLITFVFVFLFSCNRKSDPPYQFIEQNLQGDIMDDSWSFVDGVARMSPLKADTIIIGLYNIQLDNECSYAISEVGLTFYVPYAEGLYLLNGEWIAPQSVTFYNGTKSQSAWRGAIELTGIDSLTHEISGRVDATIDGNSMVNGNFVVSICE